MPDGDVPDQDVAPDDVAPERVSCVVCGTTTPARPTTGSLQVDGRGATWLCDACTRRYLRSIEGRLDEAWW